MTASYLRWIWLALALLANGCATQAPVPMTTTAPAAQDQTAVPAAASPATAVREPVATVVQVPPVQLSLQELVERNDDRLLQAYVGMTRRSVEQLMGSYRAGGYANPFRQQSFSLPDGKQYDVLYYLTRAPRAGQGITETMLTPVILRQEKIVAIGRFPLKKLRRGECPASRPAGCS